MGIQWMQAIPHEGVARTVPAPEAFSLSVRLRPGQTGWAGLCFGLDGKTGWAMLVSPEKQEAHFLELKNNAVWLDRGMRRQSVVPGREYALRGEYDGSVLRVYFLADPQQKDPWPLFEFPLKLNGQAALYAGRGGAEFSELCVSPLEKPFYTGETFTNPVMVGADPDILLHEGRYYLYNRVPNDPSSSEDAYLYNGSEHAKLDRAGDSRAIFRVTSSTDLVHWSPYKTVFSRDSVLEGAFCMSPNVTEKDGWFYLFFAGGRFRGEENFHIYCASSRSPEGPFTLKSTAPLHTDIEEIGGMPFRDDDGETYLSLVRFDRGNHIWLQKVRLADGVAAADEAPARLILRPEADYEVDEYGRIVEGAVFIRHKGLYYMIYADGHYLGHYGESCAVAENIWGPYVRQKNNPILHHHFMADGTGDGIVIYNRDRSEMYLGYHRHVSPTDVEPRMTCIDRMRFVPDPDGGPDLLTVYGPTVTPQPIPFSNT